MSFGEEQRGNGGMFNTIVGIVMLFGVLLGIYYITSWIFQLLYYLSPVVLVATLVIDHKVVVNFVKWLVSLTRKNAIMGLGAIVISAVAFPVTALLLLGRAFLRRKAKQVEQNYREVHEGELVDFEELDSKPSTLDLPELQKRTQQQQQQKNDSDYEQLFD